MRRFGLIVALLGTGCLAKMGPHPKALALADQGGRYLNDNQPARAREAFKLCLEYTPDLDRCLNGLGMAAWQAGQMEEAARWFRGAIKANTDYPAARNNLGAYYLDRQEYRRAADLFQSSLGIDPGYMDARYNLGSALFRLARQKRAQRAETSALLKLISEAESQLIRLAELAPSRADGRAMLGAVYLERADIDPKNRAADLEAARVTFDQCLSVAPEAVDCLVLGAQTSFNLGLCDTAGQRLSTLQRLGQGLDRVPGLAEKVQACLAAREAQVARLERIWRGQAAQGNLRPLYDLCSAYVDRRVVEQAKTYCTEAIRRAPKHIGSRVAYAKLLVEMQDAERAMSICEPVLGLPRKQDPDGVAYCAELIRTLRLGGGR